MRVSLHAAEAVAARLHAAKSADPRALSTALRVAPSMREARMMATARSMAAASSAMARCISVNHTASAGAAPGAVTRAAYTLIARCKYGRMAPAMHTSASLRCNAAPVPTWKACAAELPPGPSCRRSACGRVSVMRAQLDACATVPLVWRAAAAPTNLRVRHHARSVQHAEVKPDVAALAAVGRHALRHALPSALLYVRPESNNASNNGFAAAARCNGRLRCACATAQGAPPAPRA
jgi:hypothetical protein